MSKFSDTTQKLKTFILGHKRAMGSVIAVVLIAGTIVVLRQGDSAVSTGDREPGAVGPGESGGTPLEPGVAPEEGSPGGGSSKKSASSKVSTAARSGVGVSVPKAGTIPLGVDYAKQEIKVVMYWREDSRSSQFLPPGASGETVDDAKAFDAMVKYINKHAKGSASLMGTQIGMGNWIIKPTVVSMNDATGINTGTTKITKEIKPFAAITARGSLSTETCPAFAAAGIHNFATLHPYVPNLQAAYNGFCIPNALSWDQQVDVTVNYMTWHRTIKFTSVDRPDAQHSCPSGCNRVYGFLYSAYPGLKDQGPKVAQLLGIPEARRYELPVGLSTAAGPPSQAAQAKFSAAGVNTVIMPDGGSPLAFTTTVGASWRPDYYVWPCSGQDTTGYTRLLPTVQWDNAAGLTCYDDTFDADLTIDDGDRLTQWYKAFKEIYPNDEAPSSAYLVYAALQPLVEGVSRLGNRDFTVENFRAALREFEPYRYNGVSGRTNAADNILLLMGNSPDGSIWGDFARVDYESSRGQNPYRYTDDYRYKSNQSFS